MKARPHFNGGSCPYFTDGKVYDVRCGSITGRIGDVTDDRGNGRIIPLDDGRCAHIIRERADRLGSHGYHDAVGRWEILEGLVLHPVVYPTDDSARLAGPDETPDAWGVYRRFLMPNGCTEEQHIADYTTRDEAER